MQAILGFIIKEIKQTLRDPRMVVLLVGVPIIQLTIFGFALSNEVKNIRIGFWSDHGKNYSNSKEYVEIKRKIISSGWFNVVDLNDSDDAINVEPLYNGKVEAILYENIKEKNSVQLLINGTDILRARGIERYVGQIIGSMGRTPSSSIALRVLYNPTLVSSFYMVPGVVSMIVCIFTIILTSMSITKERERGTLEMLLVSPINRWQIILGKSIPFFIFGLINVLLVISAGIAIFNIPFVGNPLVLLLCTVFFLITTVGIGILISTIASTQQQAMMGGFIFLFPAILLSGIMSPISNMPKILQFLAALNPMSYYATLLRNILLKGGGLDLIVHHLAVLITMGITLYLIAYKRLKRSL